MTKSYILFYKILWIVFFARVFALYAIIIYLTGGALNSVIASTQPTGRSGTHFCGVIDGQRSKRYADQYPNLHHAQASVTVALNVGEPRTVRMIYFLPNDRPYRADIVKQMKDDIVNIQTFYAESMQAHGYQDMTFRIETNLQGEPIVHLVDGQYADIHYIDDTENRVLNEVEQVFDLQNNIYYIVVDNSINAIRIEGRLRASGIGGPYGKNGGIVLVQSEFEDRVLLSGELQYRTGAHELGHAFGLQHDFRHGTYIMSYGPRRNRNVGQIGDTQLSKCNADILAVHPYFNFNSPIQDGKRPNIKLTSPTTYPLNSESVNIQLEVSDSDGLHQVILFVILEKALLGPSGYPEVKACHKLAGKKEAIVEFKYDGDIPSTMFRNLTVPNRHPITIAAVDINGDVGYEYFTLSEMQPPSSTTKEISISYQQKINSDYQMWGLPNSVRMRLGKGGVGEMDNAVAYSPDGKHLAVSSNIGIWLYDATTYQELALMPNAEKISSLAFSPDGKTIVSGLGGDATNVRSRELNLWDVANRKKIAAFGEGMGPIVLSPDGNTLASTFNHPILWDITTGEQLVNLQENHNSSFRRFLSFSPDGTLLAVSENNTVRLWDVSTQQTIAIFNHRATTYSIAFSPDSKTLASGSADLTIKLWNVVTGTEINTIYARTIAQVLRFSPDGNILAWASGREIKLWDIATRTDIITFEDPVFSINSMAFAPDGKSLVYASSADGIVKVLDVETGSAIDLGHTMFYQYNSPISFSPNNTILATGTYDGMVKLWDVATGRNIGNLFGKRRSWVRSVTFSPDGRTIASRANETIIRLWDVETQTVFATLEEHKRVNALKFSPNGEMLAVGASNRIKLWDMVTRQNIAILDGHTERINSVGFSPDGKMIVSTSDDKTIKLWDMVTRQNITTFTHPGRFGLQSVYSATFSIDGKTFASVGYDSDVSKSVRLWDVATQTLIQTFNVHSRTNLMTFSFDGTMVLMNFHGTMSLWDITTQTLITSINGLSPDGRTFAKPTYSGTILLGDMEPLNEKLNPSMIDFLLSVEADHDFIHMPLKVTAVNGVAKTIKSIGDLYDVLSDIGGHVYSLSTWDPNTRQWDDYYGGSDRGTVADKILTDDMGIRTHMMYAITISLQGEALGTNGRSTITLHPGHNLVGIPLKDSRIERVSDLFSLDGIQNNVYSIDTINSLGSSSYDWQVETIGLPGKPSDTFVTGGQAFILSAHEGATITISGGKWSNISGTKAAPSIASIAMSQIETALLPNYPNPFNPETWIPYHLARDADVQLTIYDIKGEVVRRFSLGHQLAGYYTDRIKAAYWDGRNDTGESVASGVYFYHLSAGDYSATRRMVILK